MAQRMIWASVLLLVCWIRPAAGQTRPLTLAEARQKVRIAAQVRDEDIVRYSTETLGNRVFYHFELRNGDGYRVDRETGRIVAVVYESRFSTRTTQEVEADRLPLEVLEKVAWDTVRERYPEGAAMTLKLWEQPHFDGYAYNFHYGQVLPENGAWTDNGCSISVAADTGVLNSYSDHFEPIPPAARRQPHVSAAQAIMIAARATRSADVLEADPRLVFGPFSHGRLHWSVKFRGIAADGRVGMFGVNVDAHSGQPYEISTYNLLTYPRPPKNHTMLAGKVLQHRLGPISTAQGLLVSEKIVAALGGTLGRRPDTLEVRGETTVTLKVEHALRQGEEWFIPADAIRRAFPSTIYVLEAEPKRNAVNFICDHAAAALWYGERGQVFAAATAPPDRSAEVRAAIQKLGLAEVPTGIKKLGRSTGTFEGHIVVGGLIGGLAVFLSGFAWRLRTTRHVPRKHGG